MMRVTALHLMLLIPLTLYLSSCTRKKEEAVVKLPPHISGELLKKRLAMYAPVEITYDESLLSEPEKQALKHLIEAARIMDEIFLRQVWAGNVKLRELLEKAAGTEASAAPSSEAAGKNELAADLLHFFRINFGPWDRINENTPFIGERPKPKGAAFYPEDMTKGEFETFLKAHPDKEEAFRGFFTVIRRSQQGLEAVPYSEAYRTFLAKAAAELDTAASILTDPVSVRLIPTDRDYTTLARFLRSRARGFLSNDYFQSDMDWMDVRANIIDVTIGPYEVYEDALMGYKASFEAFIAIRNPEDSRRLEGLKAYLQELENNLPIPDEHKNPNRGRESPISVVDLVYAGGDTKAGVQTIAFNLPNDERVREAKGSKKVMLKNISRAKFDKILVPIADELLDPEQIKHVDFETYFNNTLMHEFAHGLGPGKITVKGRKTTVSRELKELYPAIEEAKADITGLYNTAYLEKKGFFARGSARRAYVCFLPGFFRAIRFGIHEAHGRANMMEFNFLAEKGALAFDEASGKFHVDLEKMPGSVEAMTRELLMIEALGDYEQAKLFIERYGEMPKKMEPLLARLTSLPVDIEPLYEADK